MPNILIVNAHHRYDFSKGEFAKSCIEVAHKVAQQKSYQIRQVNIDDVFENPDIDREIENYLWADIVFLHIPVNWMNVPWTFKKYMDEVYTAGMRGKLCAGDGRDASKPKANYGKGGKLTGKKYMLSISANAPLESFSQDDFFAGEDIDALFSHMHFNFKFFDMEALPTFAAYDLMKNPEAIQDLKRLEEHLNKYL